MTTAHLDEAYSANLARHQTDPWWMRCMWCGQWDDFNPDSTQPHPEHLGEQKTDADPIEPELVTRTIVGDVYVRGDVVWICETRMTRDQAHQLLAHLTAALDQPST